MSLLENKIAINAVHSEVSETILVLEQLPAIVYVCDIENSQVLYMNKLAKKVYGDATGKTCYEAFQKDGNATCGYCSNEQLKKDKNEEKVIVRDHFNAFDDKWYEVQDRIIQWSNGKKAKLQVAYNIDHRKEDEKKLIILYRQQELFSKIAAAFNHEESFANKVNSVLELVGNFVGVSRVSIFKNTKLISKASLIYEWCRAGVQAKINRFPELNFPPSHDCYIEIFNNKLLNAIDLEDEPYRKAFQDFRKFDVRAILLIPVFQHGIHFGFLSFEMCNEIRIWHKDEIQLINTFGNIISTSFERKRIEERRMRFEHHLKEANATKDKFFSIITKNIRIPFTDLTSLSNMLWTNYQKWDNNKRIKFIESIKESALSGYKLLENLLSWSKIQSGQIEFNKQKVDIKSVISLAIEQLDKLAKSKNIGISGIPADFVFVNADYMMINIIFKNLLSNAIKFTPNNGHIEIKILEQNSQIEVWVKDNGIGIEKKYLNSLFKIDLDHLSFGPVHDKGTGLGLIICREFIEKHGGQIWVESELGEGTCIRFTLPR